MVHLIPIPRADRCVPDQPRTGNGELKENLRPVVKSCTGLFDVKTEGLRPEVD